MYAVDYGFVLSPNQTPYRDMYFLEKLLGIGANDGVAVNTVFTRLCWLMGVWPAVYASLLLPSAKSGNKVRCICHQMFHHVPSVTAGTSAPYLKFGVIPA